VVLWHWLPPDVGRLTLPHFYTCCALVDEHRRATETEGVSRGRP